MSIGVSNPISGSFSMFPGPLPWNQRTGQSYIHGFIPTEVPPMDVSSTFPMTRNIVRKVWNTSSITGSSVGTRMITPFRAVYNAGDILSRQNFSGSDGNCMAPSRPGLNGLKQSYGSCAFGSMPSVFYSTRQINAEVPAGACNPKYVYDSSLYTRYRREMATNNNYNDAGYGGGPEHHSIQRRTGKQMSGVR